ncbi:ATP-binding protein [Jatrophihabitans cynanchi]|uniref:ATP-binding protein n=1 Tax=Jatrophihabitans cynanchi TaxID=2944128 RepID=A0ABY7JS18_9ACTN|nr:ATP-binding protein [Jatrophihabitans sp. SB3-54]WAX55129.1 ATP-binding protein [Jatrophihabitans sp. SB3-54]
MTAQIVVGVCPPGWREESWFYEDCVFATSLSTTARLAALLGEPGERRLIVGSVEAGFELPATTFSWQRLPSLAAYSQLALRWPSTEYKLHLPNQQTFQQPAGYLVGRDEAPSFPTLSAAYSAFFHGDFTLTSTGTPPLGLITVRVIDNRARINRVRIRPSSLDVWIGGRQVRGVRLELNGVQDRTSAILTKPGQVTIPLPHGLPADAWLWVKSGHEWLDFRALSGWGGRISPDVENDEFPKDPLADLTRLAAQGEGQDLEYKAKLPDTAEEKRTVFKTVVAFANGDGGTVLFGVADGDGALVGIADKMPVARRRLTDLLRDLVTPSPRTRISAHRLEGRSILMLEVTGGDGTLHALTVNKNRPEYYVRRDGTTFYARPEEIAAVVHADGSGKQHGAPRVVR